ncbi:hypothetical protein Sjap_013616 [Stephania japonica]|uniref:Protein saal1 n=1 Tax=Stephania japonica TaxID=461633 RepID=A0AAP0NZ91_9MAGN
MEEDVDQYVRTCLVGQKDKTERRKAPGLLEPLPIPERPFQSISMDFITGLPMDFIDSQSMLHSYSATELSPFEVATGQQPDHLRSMDRFIIPIESYIQKRESVKRLSKPMQDEEEEEKAVVVDDGEEEAAFLPSAPPSELGGEEAWEENGCILWDLAANKTHAELMVENLLLDVLLASLTLSQSVRIMEISLGILANLACHEVPRKCIFSSKGLVDVVFDQLFSDDSQCLCEAFRLLTLGLQGSGSISLIETLQQQHVLERILWITENTLNFQLLEKSLGLLLVIIDNQQEEARVLIPQMEKLGLVSILINLLACEMDKLSNQRMPERYSVLDMILQVLEALSVIEDFSDSISSSNKLSQLVFDLVKVPDKVEVSSCCVTAIVLIANILADVPDAVAVISKDLSLLQGLLDIIPFVSDDIDARNALWSVLGRIFAQVQDDANPSTLCHYVSLLVEKSDFIEEDLVDHRLEDSDTDKKSTSKLDAVNASLNRMCNILNRWITIKGNVAESDAPTEDHPDDENVHRLLHICCKYAE